MYKVRNVYKVSNLIPESNPSAIRFLNGFLPEQIVPPIKFVVQGFFYPTDVVNQADFNN